MAVFNVVLMWVPEGVEPTSGRPFNVADAIRFGGEAKSHNRLADAVSEALAQHVAKQANERLLPWIVASTGEGTAIFNYQGILTLSMEGIGANAQRP